MMEGKRQETKGKRHSKEDFSDLLKDLKKSFSAGKSQAAT